MGKLLPKAIGSSFNLLSYVSPGLVGQYAFRLFCTPLAGRLQAADEIFLATSEQTHDLMAPTGKFRTYIWNQQGQKTVLLLHGWESNAARWQPLIAELLAADFKVIAIDAPAHGASEGSLFDVPKYAEAIASTLQQFPVNHIVAHSVGGATLCYYLTHFSLPPIDRISLLGVPAELQVMIDNYISILGLSARTVQAMDTHFKHNFDRHFEYYSFLHFSKQIKNKTLIIHDHQDQVIPVNDGIAYQETLSDSRLVLTADFGHSLQDQSVYEEIVGFFSAL